MYEPSFTLNNKILKSIGVIEAARAVILNSPLVPSWEAKFREDALVRSTHHGTHIEGNALNLEQADAVLKGKQVIARDRDIQEVINFRNVLGYLDQLAEATGDLCYCENVLKEIHRLTTDKIMPIEKSGSYRKAQVVIRNSLTGEISFRPPPAVEVPYLMGGFFEWLKKTTADDLHPVLKAGITQYEIVRVHPFIDGNGRVARAFATLVLFKDQYDIKRFFSLEEYYDYNASDYYRALQAVSGGRMSGKYDLTPWLEYFSLGLASEFEKVKKKVQRLSTDVHIKEQMGGKQIYLSERQITIVEYIQKTGFLQNKTFIELFPKVSEDTILRDLKDLMNKGIIKKTGKTKAAQYVLKK
ncbi:Fic family protein [Candidatus Gottesmanbacteria bacterium]|nr:Fic family protein [Candidatus Gottesmanbacteria bacterium]